MKHGSISLNCSVDPGEDETSVD